MQNRRQSRYASAFEGGLYNGDCMTQREFHRLYEKMPDGFRAELINGIVYVREPVGMPHGHAHFNITTIAGVYALSTPGVQGFNDTTVILGKDDEVQPDLCLRVRSLYSETPTLTPKKLFMKKAPELVIEVAYTSKAIDLHVKRNRYALAGVREYIVVCLQPVELHWFNLTSDTKLRIEKDGVLRSKVFPGLWIHERATLESDSELMMSTLNEGLASPEHAEFVRQLGGRKIET